ncbi:MAG: cytoplasmic protein [Thermodesulfobacteriota bacterium]
MSKTALFAFRGEMMCFMHVLLNAWDLHQRGETVQVVLEGEATGLVPELADPKHSLHPLYARVVEAGLLAGACRACSGKMGVLGAIQALQIPLLDEMQGHPAIGTYQEQGYTVIFM